MLPHDRSDPGTMNGTPGNVRDRHIPVRWAMVYRRLALIAFASALVAIPVMSAIFENARLLQSDFVAIIVLTVTMLLSVSELLSRRLRSLLEMPIPRWMTSVTWMAIAALILWSLLRD